MCAVAALNFCVNALLLAGTGSLGRVNTGPWRLLLASILGAVYSGVCVEHPALASWPWRITALAAMALVTFGMDGRTGGVFVLLTLALEGAVRAAGRGGVWQLPACLVGVQALGRVAFGNPGRRLIPVEIAGERATLRLKALYDTGNRLRDPVTGEAVLVIGSGEACKLTGLSQRQLEHPLETVEAMPLPGLRLVPYRAVGTNGLLLAKRFSHVRMDGRTRPALVAFAPECFEADFQGVVGSRK